MVFQYFLACLSDDVYCATKIKTPSLKPQSLVAWTKTWRVHVKIMRQAVKHVKKMTAQGKCHAGQTLQEFIDTASANTDLKFLIRTHGDVFWPFICPASFAPLHEDHASEFVQKNHVCE